MKNWKPSEIVDIYEMKQEGYTVQQISDKYKKSYAVIQAQIAKVSSAIYLYNELKKRCIL